MRCEEEDRLRQPLEQLTPLRRPSPTLTTSRYLHSRRRGAHSKAVGKNEADIKHIPAITPNSDPEKPRRAPSRPPQQKRPERGADGDAYEEKACEAAKVVRPSAQRWSATFFSRRRSKTETGERKGKSEERRARRRNETYRELAEVQSAM